MRPRLPALLLRMIPLALPTMAACSDYEYAELTKTEVFQQPDADISADVLFVIDNSASMAEEQAQLAANFAVFVEALQDSNADFKLGVTTMDPNDGGVLTSAPLTRDTPALGEAFSAAVQVGDDGDRDERGLEMALSALSGANPGFVRDGANLNVVFFSDEDDHSPLSLQDYLDALARLAPEKDFSAHAIVGDLPDGCSSGTAAANAGARYIEATELSGGYLDSICAESYANILSRIGLELAGLIDTFMLERLPDPETLIVWVDEATIPNREFDGWTYSPGDNAVVFHGRAVPRAGMTVYVEYRVLTGGAEAPAEETTP